MSRKFSTLLLLFWFGLIKCQMPNTEIWLFKIENSKQGPLFSKPQNITNREGYDNQPSFSADGKKIFYVSVREDKQADIYIYDLKSEKTVQFTISPGDQAQSGMFSLQVQTGGETYNRAHRIINYDHIPIQNLYHRYHNVDIHKYYLHCFQCWYPRNQQHHRSLDLDILSQFQTHMHIQQITHHL